MRGRSRCDGKMSDGPKSPLAAAIAISSARRLPQETGSFPVVCAAHLHIALMTLVTFTASKTPSYIFILEKYIFP